MSETMLRCAELLDGRRTEWTWTLVDDGDVLEQSVRGTFRFGRHRVLDRATDLFQQLAAQDGVLVRFEARVRAGLTALEPTILTIDRREYRVEATGTFSVVERIGPPPALGGWSAIGDDPAENVYFLLASIDDDERALGIWTGQICLSFGRSAQ
jgi:hypothetical protein